MISLFSVQMGKLLSACACITQWIDFAPSFKHTTFPYYPFYSSSSCDREICVMKSRVSLSLLFYAWVCQILFTLPFYPPDRFCFVYAKYLLACSTLAYFVQHCFYLFLFSLRPIICSYETKLNFSSLLFLFFLFCHQVRRLLLLSCFPFLSAAHHVHCWRHDLFACVLACIGELAYFDGRALACMCVSEVAKIVVCFYFACSGKRD